MNFSLVDFSVEPRAATPTIVATLRVDVPETDTIVALALRCQIQIEPARRAYSEAEADKLYPLFGTRAEHGRTLRNLLWTHADAVLPSFTGHANVRLLLPCSFDLAAATTRLFAALDGAVPLRLLFSGTAYKIADGALQTAPVPWTSELTTELPAAVWRSAVDQHYPAVAFVPLRRDLVERLDAHRLARGLLTWDRALEDLLRAREGKP